MAIVQRQNARLLEYLAFDRQNAPVFAPPDSVRDPYYQCGAHPDIVERVWDVIGRTLPRDCRGLVVGRPALVHPVTGIVFGLAVGTQYCLRLPDGLAAQAVGAGAKTRTVWAGGKVFDTGLELGEDWVLGAWLAAEPEWCRLACEKFARPADD